MNLAKIVGSAHNHPNLYPGQNILEKLPNGNYAIKERKLYWDSKFDKDLILVQNVAPCCCPMFSRKAWVQSDYWFDENLTTSEDWDLWVNLSRHNDLHELKVIDCECSLRIGDKTQMTGNRTGYTDHLPELYKRWRKFAKNKEWVVEHQNAALKGRGLNPDDYGL